MSRMPLTATLWPPSKMSSTCTHDLVLFSGLILKTVGPTSDLSDQNDALNDIFWLCLPVERLTHGKCLCRNAGLWICGGGCCCCVCFMFVLCVSLNYSGLWSYYATFLVIMHSPGSVLQNYSFLDMFFF